MNNLASEYLTPYVLMGSVAMITAALVGLRRALRRSSLTARSQQRAFWSAATILTAWFLSALFLSRSGFYRGTPTRIPTIQYGALTPILAGVVLFWSWPALKRIVELLPQKWMVGIQLYRALGVIFLVLYAAGRLPGAFALPAGIGDVMVGLLAPAVGIAYARGSHGSAGLLRAWNLFGIADLVVAVGTGFLTSPSQLQMLALDKPNQLIDAFPLALIPVFLAPLSILLHLASLHRLGQAEVQNLNRIPPHAPTGAPGE